MSASEQNATNHS